MKGNTKRSDTRVCSIVLDKSAINLVEKMDAKVSVVGRFAIKRFFEFPLTVYGISHKYNKKIHISYFFYNDVHDKYWHHVNTSGSGTIGDAIRKETEECFKMFYFGCYHNLEDALVAIKIYRSLYKKKGYSIYNLVPVEKPEFIDVDQTALTALELNKRDEIN